MEKKEIDFMMPYNELIKNINILLADDDEDYLLMTYSFLKQIGYSVDKVTDGKQVIEQMLKKDYQILLIDYFMPNMNGEETIQEIRKTNQEIIIILQTGFSGQKPPIETMQKLNIQNYHDKTEGIDRLNLELISAVKIFNQQNEIALTRYRTNVIGSLVNSVAQEIKSDLLSISGGMEAINMLIQTPDSQITRADIENMNRFYIKNKESLEKIDKILTSVIGQSMDNADYIMLDTDIMDIINSIIYSKAKEHGVTVHTKISLKSHSYLTGSINDIVLIICEIMTELIKGQPRGAILEVVLTEDEKNWYFNLTCDRIDAIYHAKELYLIKKVVVSIKNTSLLIDDEKIQLKIEKEA